VILTGKQAGCSAVFQGLSFIYANLLKHLAIEAQTCKSIAKYLFSVFIPNKFSKERLHKFSKERLWLVFNLSDNIEFKNGMKSLSQ